MNDHDLDQLLRQARVPDRDADYPEQFARDVARTAVASERQPSPAPIRRPLAWALCLGMATACVVFGFILGDRHGKQTSPIAGRSESGVADQLAGERKLFREVAALFPDRLRAISINGGEVQLLLSEQPGAPTSPPLLVEICRDGQCRTFITFSGQELKLGDDSYEVLFNAEGDVIVAGVQNVWIGSEAIGGKSDIKVRAHLLEGHS